MPECLSDDDERPVSLFAEENRRNNAQNNVNGDGSVNRIKRPTDTVDTERMKSPKVTTNSHASEEVGSKADDSVNKTTTTHASTANIPNAQSPEANKEANAKSSKTEATNNSSDKPSAENGKPKYTLGNLINSLIVKNAPAEEDMENQLVFKTNFNVDGHSKQPKPHGDDKTSDINASTNSHNGGTASTIYLSDSDSIYSSEPNTPSSKEESSKKSFEESENNQMEVSSLNSSKNSRSLSGGSYSDCYSNSPDSVDRNKQSINNGDDMKCKEPRNDSATQKLLERRSSEKPGESSISKRRSSDLEEISRRDLASESAPVGEHDPYMFLGRMKKPRMGTDDTADAVDVNVNIIPGLKINNGNLDDIIEQEFIVDNILNRNSSITRKLLQGSLFDEKHRSFTPNDNQQQSKQGTSKQIKNNSQNELNERKASTPTMSHRRDSPLSFHPQQQKPGNRNSTSPLSPSTNISGIPTLEKAIKNIITKTMRDIKPPNTSASSTSPQSLVGQMEKSHSRNELHPVGSQPIGITNKRSKNPQDRLAHPESMFSSLSKSHPSSQQQQNSELISLTRSYGRPSRHIPSIPSKHSPPRRHGSPSQQTSPGANYLPSSTKNSLVNMDKLVSLSPKLLANITQQEKIWSGQPESHSPNHRSLQAHLSRQKQLKGFEQIQQNNGSRSLSQSHSPGSRVNGHPMMLMSPSPPIAQHSSTNNSKLNPSSHNPMGPHNGLSQAQINSIIKEAASASLNSTAAIQQQLQQQQQSRNQPPGLLHPAHPALATNAGPYLPLLGSNPNNFTEIFEAINNGSSFGKNMFLSQSAPNIGGPPRSSPHTPVPLPPHSFPSPHLPHSSLFRGQMAAANGGASINPYNHPPSSISPSSCHRTDTEPPGFHPAHFKMHYPTSYPASEMQAHLHKQQQQQQEQNWDQPPTDRSHLLNAVNQSRQKPNPFYDHQLLAQYQQQQKQHHKSQYQMDKQSPKPSQQSSSKPHQSFKKRLLSSIEDNLQMGAGRSGNDTESSPQMSGLASHLSPQLIHQHLLSELGNNQNRQMSSSHHK